MQNLLNATLICLLGLAGCSVKVREKSQDPQEVEKHRQQHIQQMQQEFAPSS
jgi:outer membrane biogenesis lipoprotein LolB